MLTKGKFFTKTRSAYLAMKTHSLNVKFLRRCQSLSLMPVGIRTRMNLSAGVNDLALIDRIRTILDRSSSRILDVICDYNVQRTTELQTVLDTCKHEAIGVFGIRIANQINLEARRSAEARIHLKQTTLNKKVNSLLAKKADGVDGFFSKGSRHLSAKMYCKLQSTEATPVPLTRAIRQHRKNRPHKRKLLTGVKERPCFIPTDEDLQRINPIVLAENVELTPCQVSICRLPDKFAPTPRSPVDAFDQLQGTRQWAERLRWTYFWSARTKNIDYNKDTEFVLTPWYQKTKRSAPKGNAALEAFINACTRDFMNPANRKRIKDNLTTNQRKAIHELASLPLTHNAACRFADKSGKTHHKSGQR